MSTSRFKLALAQLAVGSSKAANIASAVEAIKNAASNGADIVALPECFNSPYGTSFFPEYAEEIPGDSTNALREAAAENNVYVIGGSIPEREGESIFNTCAIFDNNGDMIAKHRKVHLFDIDVPGKIRFQESETLTGGDTLTMIDTPWCKIGVGICYDIRFPELAQIYAQEGCSLLVYPGAFNMTTGNLHWELLQRARAVDNQLFVAAVSPARDEKASYVAWGHSTVTNPWGEVIATTDEKEGIIYAEIDLAVVDDMRSSIPTRTQKRHDLYTSPAPVGALGDDK